MLILASRSVARRALLEQAGVAFVVEAADVDEDAVKKALAGEPVARIAAGLAARKALKVSGREAFAEAFVVGADSMLALDATHWLDKARDMAELQEQLWRLRGARHQLLTAVAVARGGEVRWQHLAVAELRMRRFSRAFLEAYLAAEGEKLLGSVGGYHIEGRGVQLFEEVRGDVFAIAGLPLVPLLGFLREVGEVAV